MAGKDGAWGSQLRKGVLELAVLGLLAQGERYGSNLVDELADRPALAISPGTVYPLLARLAKAIITHENGRCIYSDAEILDGAQAAAGVTA